jgi:DNA polymerase-3 subunit alpha
VRERLRWEKELMGLYLSDHPMGEVAERVGEFVTGYSGDLKDESLDGQRVVLGGIVTGIRSVMTKARASMAVVTIEDLQGTFEVVVFPKTYETTMGTWRDGAILLVAGRVDHRGDEASLLADSVWDWDVVAERGPEAFAKEVGSLDKRARRGPGRPGGPGGNGGNGGSGGNAGNGQANGNGVTAGSAALRPAPVPIGSEPPGLTEDEADAPEEPPLPEEARTVAAAAAQAPSRPLEAAPGAVLNVRFARDAGTDRLVSAMQAFKSVLRERPGATRVVVHVPAPGGSALPMELRGVAYDAELVAELQRRVGEGVIDLQLG